MIQPGERTIRLQILLVLGAALAVPFSLADPAGVAVVFAVLEASLVFFVLLDGLLLPGRSRFRAERIIPSSLEEGRPFTVTLRLLPSDVSFAGRRVRPLRGRYNYEIFDGLVPHLEAESLPARFRSALPLSFEYRCTPRRRSVYVLEEVFVCVTSSLGLAVRRFRLSVRTECVVHPIIPRVNEEFIAAQRRLLSPQGSQRRPAPGGEREFYRLREYVPGDEPRHIDWKASARFGAPVTREYEREQKQTLFLVVDCSRWMQVRSGGRSLLDEALSSALMLAGVAASRGDSVGFLGWGSGPTLFLPPARRENAYLARAVSRILPQEESLNLGGLAAFLSGALRNECIVVLFTSVPHEDGAEEWVDFSARVSATHRPLLALLESDETIASLSGSSIPGLARLARRGNLFPLPAIEEADPDRVDPKDMEAVAVFDYLKEKERRLRLVAGRRFGVVYCTKSGLRPSVLSEYMKIRFTPSF